MEGEVSFSAIRFKMKEKEELSFPPKAYPLFIG